VRKEILLDNFDARTFITEKKKWSLFNGGPIYF